MGISTESLVHGLLRCVVYLLGAVLLLCTIQSSFRGCDMMLI